MLPLCHGSRQQRAPLTRGLEHGRARLTLAGLSPYIPYIPYAAFMAEQRTFSRALIALE